MQQKPRSTIGIAGSSWTGPTGSPIAPRARCRWICVISGEARLDEMVARVRSLPLSSDGAIESVIEACDDPRSGMQDIATRIGREPGLAAVVLRQANSAHYAFGRRIETIPDAAVVLGLGTIRSLAITSAVLRLVRAHPDRRSPFHPQSPQ